MDAISTHEGNGATSFEATGSQSVPPMLPAGDTSTILPPPNPQPSLKFTATRNDLMEIGATLYQEAEDRLRGSRKRRLRVKLGSKTLAEVPLATGALGVLAAAMVAVALTRLTIDFE